MNDVLLVSYGEISLKGKNRETFEKRLADNVVRASGIPKSAAERAHRRLIVAPRDERRFREVREALPRVFGIHHFVRARIAASDLEAITAAARSVAEAAGTPKTFRVSTRRAFKAFPHSSQEVNETVGAALGEAFPAASVKLKGADADVVIEIHKERTFVYMQRDVVRGAGGMPVGTSGSGLLLLSGGIDSPVAGWSMLKRGMEIDALHFASEPFTGKKAQEKVTDLARVLARWRTAPVRLFLVGFTEVQKCIADNAPNELLTVLFRRSMQRIAALLAKKHGHGALISGESLGQVASQTLENIATIQAASGMLALRPLISFDKAEVIERAQQIGTYEISIQPYEDCCTVFTPKTPRTKTTPELLERVEHKLELEQLERKAIEGVRIATVA